MKRYDNVTSRSSILYPDLTVLFASDTDGYVAYIKNWENKPLTTKGISTELDISEDDVCKFLHVEPSGEDALVLRNNKEVCDNDGSWVMMNWLILTSFANSQKHAKKPNER